MKRRNGWTVRVSSEVKRVKGQISWVRLTENGQVDAFYGAGVEHGVLGPTGVFSGVRAEDLGDDEIRATVDLGVVVVPGVQAWRVGLGLTHQQNTLMLQGRVAFLRQTVRLHVNLGYVRAVCGQRLGLEIFKSKLNEGTRVSEGL